MTWLTDETNILNAVNKTGKGKKIVDHMKSKGYKVLALNIVCLEGVDYDTFRINPNRLNDWNDVRLIIRDNGEIVHCAQATTEPGYDYTANPLNSKGAARIALGQHLGVWRIGKHKDREDALVQTGAQIKVHRDRNKDGLRNGDAIDVGWFGINFHSTGIFQGWLPSKVGKWSAGCIVGRDPRLHKKFMDWCRWSGHKLFDATIFTGRELFDKGVI